MVARRWKVGASGGIRSSVRASLVLVALAAAWADPRTSAEQTTQPAVRGQTPDLGRPTRADDPLPLFDFDRYFTGSWTFEWDVPDSPLGPEGTLEGTTVYKALDAGFYEAQTKATGSAGPITWTEVIAYRKDAKVLARHITDSRKFSFLQIGPIGGDLGGYFNIYYESAPFMHSGTSVRLKTAMHLLSPVHYKTAATISVDGGPFTNYGSAWWRKDE